MALNWMQITVFVNILETFNKGARLYSKLSSIFKYFVFLFQIRHFLHTIIQVLV